jgi:glutamate dehydrogenase/leucine dehydrogenase
MVGSHYHVSENGVINGGNNKMDIKDTLSNFFWEQGKLTRSIKNITKAGQMLGIDKEDIEDIINPQDVHVFRLHTNVMGKLLSVWGCASLHNKARGIYKGGIRISPDVDIWETIELSRLMTLKTALTELEFGGAKTGINFNMESAYKLFNKKDYDFEFEKHIKVSVMKEYAHHYRGMLGKRRYVPAPDLGTGPEEMVVICNETHEPSSVTGKPEGICGWLPGRVEATGYGLYSIIIKLIKDMDKNPEEIKVAIHGFGNVGSNTALFLDEVGVKIIGVVDKDGGVFDKEGLDIKELIQYVRKKGTVKEFGSKLDNLFDMDVDILVLAAVNNSITEEIAQNVKAKFIVEGANFPITYEAMRILERKGVIVIPDIIASSGGVIASSEEYLHSTSTTKITKENVFKIISERIDANLVLAFERSEEENISLDLACTLIAVERIYHTMQKRGWV